MPNWNETKKFKKLQASWYKKLEKSGFKDHESDESYLKQYSGTITASDSYNPNEEDVTWDQIVGQQLKQDSKQEYFRWCRHMLNDFKFKNKLDKQIFAMHSEGVGERGIAKELGFKKTTLHLRLTKIIVSMKK